MQYSVDNHYCHAVSKTILLKMSKKEENLAEWLRVSTLVSSLWKLFRCVNYWTNTHITSDVTHPNSP